MAYLLPLLCMIACPVGMDVMMWASTRGNKQQTTQMARAMTSATTAVSGQGAGGASPNEPLVALRAHVSTLDVQEASIAEKIRTCVAESKTDERKGVRRPTAQVRRQLAIIGRRR